MDVETILIKSEIEIEGEAIERDTILFELNDGTNRNTRIEVRND